MKSMRKPTCPAGNRRLIDMPEEYFAECKALRRKAVLMDFLMDRSDDEIYRDHIEAAIEMAREEGFDESDVEVVAAQTRRDIADALASFEVPREADEVMAEISEVLDELDELKRRREGEED
jgi:hypothetical protein